MRAQASAGASAEPPAFHPPLVAVVDRPKEVLPVLMRRLLVPLVLLLVMLAVPATGHAYTLGVSDQQASTFTNPLFAPLKFKTARYITPYDVMDSPNDLAATRSWITAAQAAHQRVLVSFERSHRSGRERHLPSVAEYK